MFKIVCFAFGTLIISFVKPIRINDYITRDILAKTGVEADWATMLTNATAESNHVGAYDSGKIRSHLWTPSEAFIPKQTKFFYDETNSCDNVAGRACDPYSLAPCCSPFGWCGDDLDFCSCSVTLIESNVVPCVDYRLIKDDVKPIGYQSTWQSGSNEIPILIFWKFPHRVAVYAFEFQKSYDLQSQPIEFEVQGSSNLECWNTSAKSNWTTFYTSKLDMFQSTTHFKDHIDVQNIRLAFCVGILIINTYSNKASLDSIRMWYSNLSESAMTHMLTKIQKEVVTLGIAEPVSVFEHNERNDTSLVLVEETEKEEKKQEKQMEEKIIEEKKIEERIEEEKEKEEIQVRKEAIDRKEALEIKEAKKEEENALGGFVLLLVVFFVFAGGVWFSMFLSGQICSNRKESIQESNPASLKDVTAHFSSSPISSTYNSESSIGTSSAMSSISSKTSSGDIDTLTRIAH